MQNLINNSKQTFKNIQMNKHATAEELKTVVEFYLETITQIDAMKFRLSGIEEEELTKAEKQILRIIEE